jgi:hypothetical protein
MVPSAELVASAVADDNPAVCISSRPYLGAHMKNGMNWPVFTVAGLVA